jgi:two-component system sensor histidine kinase CpxA
LKLHSLFFKLFLGFWVATTLVALSLLLLETNRSDQLAKRWHRMTADAFTVYADSAADAHVDEAQWESKAYLSDLEKRTGIRAWLFDGQNKEGLGISRPNARAAHSTGKAQRIRVLITRARATPTTEFDPHGNVTLAAHATSPMKGQRYVLVGELPVARFGPWEADLDVQALRFLAVLLAAGVVCWGLGRHLTQPIVVLREATRRMAAGDLSARPGASLGRRRDELAELSRDFDGMAGRIESLLEEQNRLVQAQCRLLGDVSHELRSPLARLGVALELARDCTRVCRLHPFNSSAASETAHRLP